jgi:AsmA protein
VVGLPVAVNFGLAPDTVSSLVVQAGPRDAILITTPVRLSMVPDIVLESGLIYDADATANRAKPAPARIILDAPLLTVAASAGQLVSGDAPEDELPLVLSQLAALTFDKLTVRRGSLVIASIGVARSALTDVTAEVVSNNKGGYSAKGSAIYRGSRVRFDITWSRPADPKSAHQVPIKLSVTAPALDASVEGKLLVAEGLRLLGSADVSVHTLQQLAQWFGIRVASSVELKDVKLKGSLDWHAGTLTFSRASVSADGNEATGSLAVATSSPLPAIDATLAFQSLDLSRYSAPAPSVASLWPLGFGSPEDDVASPLLSSFDADLRMSAAKLTLPHVQTGRAAATISLKKGRLLADVAELEIEGGNFGGQVTADATGSVQRYSVRGKFENIDAGRGFSEMLQRNPLQGRANVAIDLSGSGGTVSDVLASLTGKLSLSLTEGGRLGLDLRALRYAAQRSTVTGWAAAGKGQTPLEHLDARLAVHNGIVMAEQLQARGGGLAIGGTGNANLAGRTLDLTLRFNSATAGERLPAGGDAIVLSGPWANPVISLGGPLHRAAAPAQ